MTLTKYTQLTNIIETLGTNPEDRMDLTDETFKAKFDQNAANLKAYINDTLTAETDTLISTHMGETITQKLITTRDLASAGVQTISGLIGVPKMIEITACVDNSVKRCIGKWLQNGQFVQFVVPDTGFFYNSNDNAVQIADANGANYTIGQVQNVTSSQFEINWSKGGSGATGTVSMYIMVLYH